MPWLLLVLAILTETIGTTALKASAGFTRLAPSLVTVCAYAASFWLLAHVLKTVPVGIAYAIWSGLGIAFIAVIGWLWFGERLDAPAMIGMGLIVAGIVVMQVFSNSTGH
ncbi:SMR family transporter [Jannaschia formosa]|uniref:SMR family transporter n=1 Tax=Jannaschia formosa TaxID=2259592 RepID=UPI000E1B83A9|nr:SMR family transporter [Jannaschia formosa]TFL17062.1 QacE family quaternary ammonium compound efflux SMR transporter [Jannaschia formosa]